MIDTEIISMSLTGTVGGVSRLVIAAPGGSDPDNVAVPPCCHPGPSANGGPGCSPGRIDSQATGAADFPAHSFFDVFVELMVPGLPRLFNQNPIHMEAVIDRIPPAGTVYIDPLDPCVPLHYVTNPFGPTVVFLGHAQHRVESKNHDKCYNATDLKQPKFVPQIVSLNDQFGPQPAVVVKKPAFVCNPADKNGEGIDDLEAHLCCYKVKGPKFALSK